MLQRGKQHAPRNAQRYHNRNQDQAFHIVCAALKMQEKRQAGEHRDAQGDIGILPVAEDQRAAEHYGGNQKA